MFSFEIIFVLCLFQDLLCVFLASLGQRVLVVYFGDLYFMNFSYLNALDLGFGLGFWSTAGRFHLSYFFNYSILTIWIIWKVFIQEFQLFNAIWIIDDFKNLWSEFILVVVLKCADLGHSLQYDVLQWYSHSIQSLVIKVGNEFGAKHSYNCNIWWKFVILLVV